MEPFSQQALQRCVWRAWAGQDREEQNDAEAHDVGWQQVLEEIMTGHPSATTWQERLRPELRAGLEDVKSVAQVRQLLLQAVMRHCPQFQQLWMALYQQHHLTMYQRAYWLLRSEADAEDIVQSLLTGSIAWVLLQEQVLGREMHWQSYLRTCVRRACLERIEQHGAEVMVEELEAWSQADATNDSYDAADAWTVYRSLRDALEQRLHQKIETARQRQREKEAEVWSRRHQILVWLLQIPPLLQQEIARQLGVSEATVSIDCKHVGQELLQILHEGESSL